MKWFNRSSPGSGADATHQEPQLLKISAIETDKRENKEEEKQVPISLGVGKQKKLIRFKELNDVVGRKHPSPFNQSSLRSTSGFNRTMPSLKRSSFAFKTKVKVVDDQEDGFHSLQCNNNSGKQFELAFGYLRGQIWGAFCAFIKMVLFLLAINSLA